MEVFNHVLDWTPDIGEHGQLVMPINDIQYDGPDGAADLPKLIKHLAWGMERNALFIYLGDGTDFGSTSERHILSGSKLHETSVKRLERAAYQDVLDLYKALAPTKGRWIGFVQGHHYFEFGNGHTSDTLLAEWLGGPYLGDAALGFFRFKDKSGHQASLKAFFHHGSGGSGVMPAAAINKLYHMKVGYPAVQLFCQAHVPQLGAVKIDSLDITDVPEPVIFDASTRFVACGGWSRSMQMCSSFKGRKQGSYAEKAMMRPGVMGGAVINLTPERERKAGKSIYQVDVKVTI